MKKEIFENLMRCIGCGRTFDKDEFFAWIDQVEHRILGDIVIERENNEDGRKPKCPNCGSEVQTNWNVMSK